MNAVTFDTHAAVRELRAADLTEQQAEALVRVLAHAVGEPVTKTDFDAAFKDLGTAVSDLDARLKGLDAKLKGLGAAINDLRDRTDFRIAELETRLIKWMVGMTVTLAGVMLAAGTVFAVAILRALE